MDMSLQDATSAVRNIIYPGTEGYAALRGMVIVRIEAARDRLESETGETALRTQGGIRELRAILEDLAPTRRAREHASPPQDY